MKDLKYHLATTHALIVKKFTHNRELKLQSLHQHHNLKMHPMTFHKHLLFSYLQAN